MTKTLAEIHAAHKARRQLWENKAMVKDQPCHHLLVEEVTESDDLMLDEEPDEEVTISPVLLAERGARGNLTHHTIKRIKIRVANAGGVTVADLESPSRNRRLCDLRHRAMWSCMKYCRNSMVCVGRYFGGRDHATVLNAIRRINRLRVEAGRKPSSFYNPNNR